MSTPQNSVFVAAAMMIKAFQFEVLKEAWKKIDDEKGYLPHTLPTFLKKVNEDGYLPTIAELREWWQRLSEEDFKKLWQSGAATGADFEDEAAQSGNEKSDEAETSADEAGKDGAEEGTGKTSKKTGKGKGTHMFILFHPAG